MGTPVTHDDERLSYAGFAMSFSDQEYRELLADLYRSWTGFNRRFFSGQLREPHLAIGRTAPRSLGHCAQKTDYGGRLQITLNRRLFFDVNRSWIVTEWPSEGVHKFIDDLLLRFSTQQCLLEIHQKEKRGYRGFGPFYAREANRIGIDLLLGKVTHRHGTDPTADGPLCRGWPHCVRGREYYGDDIREELFDLAVAGPAGHQAWVPQGLGTLEYLQYLLVQGRQGEALRLIERHMDWLRRIGSSPLPVRGRVERGLADVDKNDSPLGEVTLNPAWLRWNDGTVWRIAQTIQESRSFADLPILADALEDAGCGDERILRHLRERMAHDSRCWVLKLLLAIDVAAR